MCVLVFVDFFVFFFPFVNFFYTSLVESPTNFQQRYANYAHYTVQPRSHTTHSAARPPLEEGRSHHLEISSAIVSGGEERVKNKIDFNDNKKYIYIEKKKKPRNTGGQGTDFGWWPHSPGKALPTRAGGGEGGRRAPNHRVPRTHSSAALFPFAQANTYRERLSIKGLWGRRGSVQGKVSASEGWAGALACLQPPRGPALAAGDWVAMAGARGKGSPAGRTSPNVTFSGTENQSTVAAAAVSRVYCVAPCTQNAGPGPSERQADVP